MMNHSGLFISREFPFVIRATPPAPLDSLLRFMEDKRDWLTTQLHRHGAILFRGFSVLGAADLHSLASSYFNDSSFPYTGGVSPRTHVTGSVYTSTEWTPILRIPLHGEMSYANAFPSALLFHCERPARVGGATPLADARSVYERVRPVTREKFEELGIQYRRYYFRQNSRIELLNRFTNAHKTWMQVFSTDDPRQVERTCAQQALDYDWQPDGGIVLTNVLPAVRCHPVTGDCVWFNQAHAFNHYARNIGWLSSLIAAAFYSDKDKFMHRARFGDGSPIPKSDVYELLRAFAECTTRLPWSQGDVLLVDNLLTAHGRDPYLGDRRVLTSLH